MRIKARHIRHRDVISSLAFAHGRCWTSPQTGHSLVIVGKPGDADEVERGQAFFVQEGGFYIGSLYPDLPEEIIQSFQTPHERYRLARRLDARGMRTLSQEVILIRLHENGAIEEVELNGYGPVGEPSPDGISIAEIIQRDSNEEPWSVTMWPHQDRMMFVSQLEPNMVIRSEQFTHVRNNPRRVPRGLTLPQILHINDHEACPPEQTEHDNTLPSALFVVEERRTWVDSTANEWGEYEYQRWMVHLRRLNVDGSYDKNARCYALRQSHEIHDQGGREHPFYPVEVLGRLDGRRRSWSPEAYRSSNPWLNFL